MKINIVGGRGEMGRVHKPVFESLGYEVILSGRNSSPSIEEASELSDLTIVSVPIGATEEIIRRVAPYSKALMDFTSVKLLPIEWMLKDSSEDCEVQGLHPLYGNVNSIKGRTIIYCPTERTGEKCSALVKSLGAHGVNMVEMDAKFHDLAINGFLQNNRVKLLEAFVYSLDGLGISMTDAYKLAPPLTKTLLDLAARQANPSNDELYRDMRVNNPFDNYVSKFLENNLRHALNGYNPEKVRQIFGEELKSAQERAQKIIDFQAG
jgi:prephenate dehydrogenase